jgi:glycosyltransferase involved in cell wall biosynthesis
VISLHIDEQRGWRGGEQQAASLVRGLGQRGQRVLLAGRPGAPFLTRDHGAGAQRHAFGFRNAADLVTAARLAGVVHRERVDIVHAHTSHAHHFACLACKLAGRGRVVVTRRVDFPPSRNPLTAWRYANADRVVAISECIAGVMRAYGVAEDRLAVIHSTQDPARLAVDPLPRNELGVSPDAKLLLCPAALVGHKDHATLLAAMACVRESVPEACLLLAGEGPLRPQLEEQAGRLRLGDSVRFLGQRDDVPRLLQTADLFVLSSAMEGMGSAVIEALMCGLPVVATEAGGIPENIRHEETGLLAPVGNPGALGDAIVRLLRDPALASRLAGAGKRFALAERSADTMVERYVRLYEEVLA